MLNDFDSIFSDSSQFQELLIIDPREGISRKSKFSSKLQSALNERDPLYKLTQQIREIKLELLEEEKETESKDCQPEIKKPRSSEPRPRRNEPKSATTEKVLRNRKTKSEERSIVSRGGNRSNSEQPKSKVNASGCNTMQKKTKQNHESILQKVAHKLKTVKDSQDIHENKYKSIKSSLETVSPKVKECNSKGINIRNRSRESNNYKPTERLNDRNNYRRARPNEQSILKVLKPENNVRKQEKSVSKLAIFKKTVPSDYRKREDQVEKDLKHHEKTGVNKQLTVGNKIENRSRSTFAKDSKIRVKVADPGRQLPKKHSDSQKMISKLNQTDFVRNVSPDITTQNTVSVVKDSIAKALDDFDIYFKRPTKPGHPNNIEIVPKREHRTREVFAPKVNLNPRFTKTKHVIDNILESSKQIDNVLPSNKEVINNYITETEPQLEKKILNNIFIPISLAETKKEACIINEVTYNSDTCTVSKITHHIPNSPITLHKAIDKVILPVVKEAIMNKISPDGLQAKNITELQSGKEIQGKTFVSKKETETLNKVLTSKGRQKLEPTTNIKNEPSSMKTGSKGLEEEQIKGREISSDIPQRLETAKKKIVDSNIKIHSSDIQRIGTPVNRVRESRGIVKPDSAKQKETDSPAKGLTLRQRPHTSVNRARDCPGVISHIPLKKDKRSSDKSPSSSSNPQKLIGKTNEVLQEIQNVEKDTKYEQIKKSEENNTNIKDENKVQEKTSQSKSSVPLTTKIGLLNKLIKEKSPEIIKICNALLNSQNVKPPISDHETDKADQKNIQRINSKENDTRVLYLKSNKNPSENVKIKLSVNLLQSLQKIKDEALKAKVESSTSKIDDKINQGSQTNVTGIPKAGEFKDKDKLNPVSLRSKCKSNVTMPGVQEQGIKSDLEEGKKVNAMRSRSTSPENHQNDTKYILQADEINSNQRNIKNVKSIPIYNKSKSSQRQTDQEKFTEAALKAEHAKINAINEDNKLKQVLYKSKSLHQNSNQQIFTKQTPKTETINMDINHIKSKEVLSSSVSEELQDQMTSSSFKSRSQSPQLDIITKEVLKIDFPKPKSSQTQVVQQVPIKQIEEVNNDEKEIKTNVLPTSKSLQQTVNKDQLEPEDPKVVHNKSHTAASRLNQHSLKIKSPQVHCNQQTINKYNSTPEESKVTHKSKLAASKLNQHSPRSKSPQMYIDQQTVEEFDAEYNKLYHLEDLSSNNILPRGSLQVDQQTVNKNNIEYIKPYHAVPRSNSVSPRSKSPKEVNQGVHKHCLKPEESNIEKMKPSKSNPASPRSKSPQQRRDQLVKDPNKNQPTNSNSVSPQTRRKVLNTKEFNVGRKVDLSPRSKSPIQQINQQVTKKDLEDSETQTIQHFLQDKLKQSQILMAAKAENIASKYIPPKEKLPTNNFKFSDEIFLLTRDYTNETLVENYGSLENVMELLSKSGEDDADLRNKFAEKMKKNDDTLRTTLKNIKSREKQTEKLLKTLPKVKDSKLTSISKLSEIPLKPEVDDKYNEILTEVKDKDSPKLIIVPSENDLEMQEKQSLLTRISEMETLRNKLVDQLAQKNSTFDLNNEVSRMRQKCYHLQKDNKMLERRLIYLMQQNFEKIDDLRDHLRYLTKQETDIVYSYRDLQGKVPEISDIQNENNKILKRLTENPVTLDPGVSKQLKDELRTLSNNKICLESDLFKLKRDEIDLKDRLQHKKRIHIIEKAEIETEIKKLESVLRNTRDSSKELEGTLEKSTAKIQNDSLLEIEKIKKLDSCVKELVERYKRIANEKKELEKINASLKEKVMKRNKEVHGKVTAQNHDAKDE